MKTRYKLKATCFNKRGDVLSVAENSYSKTHPIQAYFAAKVGQPHRKYLHAEIHAILRCKAKQIHHLAVERLDKAGNMLESTPCPVCMEAIKAYGICYISYVNSNHLMVTEKLC